MQYTQKICTVYVHTVRLHEESHRSQQKLVLNPDRLQPPFCMTSAAGSGSSRCPKQGWFCPSLVPSPLLAAILTKAQKVVWQTESTFLGLVTSNSQNREYQITDWSQDSSVSHVCLEIAYSRPRIEAALSNASRRLGYQHLTEEQREAVIHFVISENVFVSLPTRGYMHLHPEDLSLSSNCLPPPEQHRQLFDS